MRADAAPAVRPTCLIDESVCPDQHTLRVPCTHPSFVPFGFPPRARHYSAQSPHMSACGQRPELGKDHTWLPVTHTYQKDEVGVWFYYAPGCSDVFWNVGRTIKARNRCHAAIQLSRLRHGGSDSQAAERVDTHITRYVARHELPVLSRARRRASSVGLNGSNLASLVSECARGLLGECDGPQFTAAGSLRLCTCNQTRGWRGTVLRSLTLSELAGSGMLDRFLLQHMQALR